MPSLFTLYRKIFFSRKPGWDQQPLPSIAIQADNVMLSKVEIVNICGDIVTSNKYSETIPITIQTNSINSY